MKVFAQPSRASDALPLDPFGRRVIAHMFGGAPQLRHQATPWRILAERARLLVTDPNSGLRIYGAPASDNSVCYETLGIGGNCVSDSFPVTAQSGRHWDQSISPFEGRCYPLSVVGIVPNDVQWVSLVIDRHEYRAIMGRNAFLYVTTTGKLKAHDVTKVIVHYGDGSRVVTHMS
jgi:hypothetical protein